MSEREKNPHAQAMQRLSVAVWSAARAAAARQNGKLGGRPLGAKHAHRARHVGEVEPRATSWVRLDSCGCGASRNTLVRPDGTVSYGQWKMRK